MENFINLNIYDNYEISNLGNVRNTKTNKIIKQSIHGKGYYKCKLLQNGKQKTVNIHRLLGLIFINNPDNKKCIDHIDSNKKNNSIDNLRWCSTSENIRNSSKRFDSSSKYYGVYKEKNKFRVRMSINGKRINVGIFKNEIDGAKAYNNKVLEINDKFRKLNILT